jgi:hypothetical protein
MARCSTHAATSTPRGLGTIIFPWQVNSRSRFGCDPIRDTSDACRVEMPGHLGLFDARRTIRRENMQAMYGRLSEIES